MKMKDALKHFVFTDAAAIVDKDDNVVGCVFEDIKRYCTICNHSDCKVHPIYEVGKSAKDQVQS